MANEEHARDLPIINGIKEDIKSMVVMEAGTPFHQEALLNLSLRLKTLEVLMFIIACSHHNRPNKEEKGIKMPAFMMEANGTFLECSSRQASLRCPLVSLD